MLTYKCRRNRPIIIRGIQSHSPTISGIIWAKIGILAVGLEIGAGILYFAIMLISGSIMSIAQCIKTYQTYKRLYNANREVMRWTFALLVLCLTSCSNGGQHEVGQYVYADCFGTVHVDRECASKLTDNPKTKEERMVNMQGISFIDTCALTGYINQYNKFGFCHRCIDDATYSHLSAIMEQNLKKQEEAEMDDFAGYDEDHDPNNNLYRAYQNALKFFSLPDFDTFQQDMKDEQKRRRFHTNIQEVYSVPDFDTFSRDIGAVTVSAPVEQTSQAHK